MWFEDGPCYRDGSPMIEWDVPSTPKEWEAYLIKKSEKFKTLFELLDNNIGNFNIVEPRIIEMVRESMLNIFKNYERYSLGWQKDGEDFHSFFTKEVLKDLEEVVPREIFLYECEKRDRLNEKKIEKVEEFLKNFLPEKRYLIINKDGTLVPIRYRFNKTYKSSIKNPLRKNEVVLEFMRIINDDCDVRGVLFKEENVGEEFIKKFLKDHVMSKFKDVKVF